MLLNLGFTLTLPGELYKMLCLGHSFKDSDLIVWCMLGAGSFSHSLSYYSVQPRLRISDLDMRLMVGNPQKLDFRVRLECYKAMWYQAMRFAVSAIYSCRGSHLCCCSRSLDESTVAEFRSLVKELRR